MGKTTRAATSMRRQWRGVVFKVSDDGRLLVLLTPPWLLLLLLQGKISLVESVVGSSLRGLLA